MRRLKNLRQFNSDTNQIANIKEAPVVNLFTRRLPEIQPIYLLSQQLVQEVKAPASSLFSVKQSDIIAEESLHLG